MEKCLYILEHDLPSPATPEEIAHVKTACDLDKAQLGGTAKRYAAFVWRIHESQLRGAIITHIQAGRWIFRKKLYPPPTYIHLEANISLTDELDVYVEMVLMPNDFITIFAHNHRPEPRLPQ